MDDWAARHLAPIKRPHGLIWHAFSLERELHRLQLSGSVFYFRHALHTYFLLFAENPQFSPVLFIFKLLQVFKLKLNLLEGVLALIFRSFIRQPFWLQARVENPILHRFYFLLYLFRLGAIRVNVEVRSCQRLDFAAHFYHWGKYITSLGGRAENSNVYWSFIVIFWPSWLYFG